MRGYLLRCCDCGLVHELQFNVVKQTSPPDARGVWQARLVKSHRVEFRARRWRKQEK